MDDDNRHLWQSNVRRFQSTLERLTEKYSMVQHGLDAVEVDLDNTNFDTLERQMEESKMQLDNLESTRFDDLRVEPLQDISRHSVFDSTCKERSGDFETTSLSEVTQNSSARYTGTLDESQRSNNHLSDQPEDQDEVLEMSLQSHSSSLWERYPDMVHRIRMAWHRQQVSDAADSVRRRYRRWQHSTVSHSNNSSQVVQQQKLADGRRLLFSKHHKSPVKNIASSVAKVITASPVKIVTVSGQKSQSCRSPVRRSEDIVVMDIPAVYEESQRIKNQTFTILEPSLLHSGFISSPSRSGNSPLKPINNLDIRMKESFMSPGHQQTAHSSVQGSGPVRTSHFKGVLTSKDNFNEHIEFYGSPTRKSPFKPYTRKERPQLCSSSRVASPKSPFMKLSLYQDLKRSNESSSKLALPRRTLAYPDQHLSPQHWSPQLAKPRSQQGGFRRHLSFDSSTQPLSRSSSSSEDIDNDFTKLYHKLVCLNKSLIKGHPCRFCAQSPEASRGHSSSSSLAALALSPHRPLLRKRYLDLQSSPCSKRFRDGQV